MLVLGDCDKIADELFNESSKKTEANTESGTAQLESATMQPMLNFNNGNGDILNDSSFSLKSFKKKATDRVEREVITYVLKRTDWNRSKASKILKVSYKTLLNKIAELGIVPSNGSTD
jgi:DNA-binding NtrC family response regulator